jgi:hypothetical protein
MLYAVLSCTIDYYNIAISIAEGRGIFYRSPATL